MTVRVAWFVFGRDVTKGSLRIRRGGAVGTVMASGAREWPLAEGVILLASDGRGLFALNKPAGVLSHPNTGKDLSRSLLTVPYDVGTESFRWKAGGARREVFLLNRLDSATSGVILCADNPAVAAAVRDLFAAGEVQKTYHALVFGVMKPPRQIWKDRLRVSKPGGVARAATGEGDKVETSARLIRPLPGRGFPVSLLELRPRTGRTHQLRVQCAGRKLPIVGDRTYGQFAWNREFARRTGRKRLFLHSAEVALAYELEGGSHPFSARSPLPPDFAVE